MKDIQQLREAFDKLENADYLTIIKFYESNIEAINLLNPKNDENQYNFKMRLQSEYGLSLVSAGYYTLAVSVLDDSIKMFENSPTIEIGEIHEITYFEHLLWNYGVALWETKNIPETTKIFERLVKNYPKNEKYSIWLRGLKAEKIKKITKPLWIICGLWLIGELTIFEKLDQNIQLILSFMGVLLLIAVGIAELYIFFITKDKKKTNAQKKLS